MVRILVADDHEVVRRGVRTLLESSRRGWQICGEASSGQDALELAVQLQPDVAVLDLAMAGLDGLEAARQIRRLVPQTEVLIFSMHDDEHLVRDALAAGANGYVLKSETGQHLVAAIEALAQHKPYFSGAAAATVLESLRKDQRSAGSESAGTEALTSRQLEVVRLLAEGKSNQEIASLLHISVKTAKTHRAAIMRRLDARSIVDVVRYAVRHGLIAP